MEKRTKKSSRYDTRKLREDDYYQRSRGWELPSHPFACDTWEQFARIVSEKVTENLSAQLPDYYWFADSVEAFEPDADGAYFVTLTDDGARKSVSVYVDDYGDIQSFGSLSSHKNGTQVYVDPESMGPRPTSQTSMRESTSSNIDAWWEKNYQKAMDFVERFGPDAALLACEDGDEDAIDAFLDSTLKHQALDVVHSIGIRAFEKLMRDVAKKDATGPRSVRESSVKAAAITARAFSELKASSSDRVTLPDGTKITPTDEDFRKFIRKYSTYKDGTENPDGLRRLMRIMDAGILFGYYVEYEQGRKTRDESDRLS